VKPNSAIVEGLDKTVVRAVQLLQGAVFIGRASLSIFHSGEHLRRDGLGLVEDVPPQALVARWRRLHAHTSTVMIVHEGTTDIGVQEIETRFRPVLATRLSLSHTSRSRTHTLTATSPSDITAVVLINKHIKA
jgi:hypothetical protein